MTLQQLSDDSSPWSNSINLNVLVSPPGRFVYKGKFITLTTVTAGTYTPLNRSAGTLTTLVASGQTGSFWTPYIGDMVYDATTGSSFWVYADLGSATAQISTPLSLLDPTTDIDISDNLLCPTPSPGDTLVIQRPTRAWCQSVAASTATVNYGDSATYMYAVDCTGSFGSSSLVPVQTWYSKFEPQTTLSACVLGTFVSDFFAGPMLSLGTYVIGGVVSTTDNGLGCPAISSPTTFDGDIIFASQQHALGNNLNFYGAYLTATGLHTYTQPTFISIGATNYSYDWCSWPSPPSVMWGPASISVENLSNLKCQNSCVTQLLLTGGLRIETLTTGTPWQSGSNSWGSDVTITPVAIDTAGAICNVPERTCYIH